MSSQSTRKTAANKPEEDIVLDDPKPSAWKTCPYHKHLLALTLKKPGTTDQHDAGKGKGKIPMERWLTEDPSEEPAIFLRPDTGAVNIGKGCTCGNAGKKSERANI